MASAQPNIAGTSGQVVGEDVPDEGETMASTSSRGVILIHSAPRALCPHLEWAVGRSLGRAVNFEWADQPVLSGARRAEYYWEGPVGTGAALATAIRGWEHQIGRASCRERECQYV